MYPQFEGIKQATAFGENNGDGATPNILVVSQLARVWIQFR